MYNLEVHDYDKYSDTHVATLVLSIFATSIIKIYDFSMHGEGSNDIIPSFE